MSVLRKLFGGLDITWPKLIIWAVVIGAAVGGLMLIPGVDDTSVKDIGTTFEWWIFFGVVIVSNSKSPVDSAAKAFVFFLISQPLIYLVQVPFSDMGWGLFGYYKNWIGWTLATIPMGAVGHFVRRGDVISSLILAPMTVFLAVHLYTYTGEVKNKFPHHLVTAILCAVFIAVTILGIARTKNAKIVSWLIAGAAVAAMIVIGLFNRTESYSPTISCAENGIEVNAESQVVGTVNIRDCQITELDGRYMLHLEMNDKEGRVIIETDGRDTTYVISYNEEEKTFYAKKE
ncbi:MAG: hypothetical protein IJR91_06075 [Ruminococcus sp.]|nr:hypothetical protein [Ruminococcus sp.]